MIKTKNCQKYLLNLDVQYKTFSKPAFYFFLSENTLICNASHRQNTSPAEVKEIVKLQRIQLLHL